MNYVFRVRQAPAAWRDKTKVCPVCGDRFGPKGKISRVNWEATKTCGAACGAKLPRKHTGGGRRAA
jgi:hypothetical protein